MFLVILNLDIRTGYGYDHGFFLCAPECIWFAGVGPGSASVTLASEAQRAKTPPLLPLPTLDRLMEADKLKARLLVFLT